MRQAVSKKASVRRQRSIYQVHYNIKRDEEMTAKPLVMPSSSLEVQKYGRQVAGHKNSEDTKFLGLLQCNNGTILKPILKESQRREVAFYSRLQSASEPALLELRQCVPQYFGCTQYTYGGFTQDYIVLEDLCARMLEPCIMDVKIGKRTWDPLATEEKIKNEQRKYAQCKQQYGFCIPGFQVYRLATGQLCKYNKEYGKRLHSHAVVDALRNYLNGVGTNLCRALLLQFLSQLWRIQRWSRQQRGLKLYSSSLLLVYDAARLRTCCGAPRLPRRRSAPSLEGPEGSRGRQLGSALAPAPASSPWSAALERLNRNHSFEHDYEDKLCKIKMNYRATLDRLAHDRPPAPSPWGAVKLIDFAHAFFDDDDDTFDDNFREGIDRFVEIFEFFLRETDDQVI